MGHPDRAARRRLRGAAALALALSAAAVVLACGGADRRAEQGTTAPARAAPSAREQAEERLRARQQAACERMCARLTECAIEDTRRTDPSQLEGVPLDKLAAAHSGQCSADCTGPVLSERQVGTIENCIAEPRDCQALVDCLQAAQRRARTAP